MSADGGSAGAISGHSRPEPVVTSDLLSRCRRALRDPPERYFNNLARHGSTAGASVPICLHEALAEGRIKDGDLVMPVAFGTGFSWGATLLRW